MCPEHAMELCADMPTNVQIFWSELLDKIEERKVIPVVGPNLIEIELDGAVAPLEDHVARRFAKMLGLAETTEAPLSGSRLFDVVARAYQNNRYDDYHVKVNRLCKDIGIPEIPSAISSLARIKDFNLYLTLGFDNLLQRALGEERVLPCHLAFTSKSPCDDLPKALNSLAEPLVYALFGKSTPAPEFVISEDDLLKWVGTMQNPDKRPSLLFDALRDGHLLFIGCNLPDWVWRFFIKSTREHSLLTQDATETLIALKPHDHDHLVTFLDRFSPMTRVLDMAPQAFVAELETRWLNRQAKSIGSNNSSALPVDINPGGVFLSYATEDQDAVKELYEGLVANNIDTWFDDSRMKKGHIEKVVGRNIERCGVFIPVLSANALARLKTWRGEKGSHHDEMPWFLKEWKKAIERQIHERGGAFDIIPVFIDIEKINFDNEEIKKFFPPEIIVNKIIDAPEGKAEQKFFDIVRLTVHDSRNPGRS